LYKLLINGQVLAHVDHSNYPSFSNRVTSTKERRPQQKHVKCIDVPEEAKKKKKSIKYKIEPKAINQTNQGLRYIPLKAETSE
jgi:hypothetical protein